MKSLIIISPNYLQACYKESTKYSFRFIGYGSFELCMKSIDKVNLKDIMGIAYLCDKLPSNSKENESMHKLYNLLNISGYKGKLLFIVSDFSKENFKQFEVYTNINKFVIEHKDIVTDVTINSWIFGNIFLDNNRPYKLKYDEERSNISWHTTSLQYIPVVPMEYTVCFREVAKLSNVDSSLLSDKVLSFLKSNNFIIGRYIREAWIRKSYGLSIDSQLFMIDEVEPVKSVELKNILNILKEVEYGYFIG